MLVFQRERTPSQAVLYALYLYFLGLSFRGVSRAPARPICKENAHGCVEVGSEVRATHRVFDVKRVQAFLVDETYVKVGSFEA
jgi:hypothetical protein